MGLLRKILSSFCSSDFHNIYGEYGNCKNCEYTIDDLNKLRNYVRNDAVYLMADRSLKLELLDAKLQMYIRHNGCRAGFE